MTMYRLYEGKYKTWNLSNLKTMGYKSLCLRYIWTLFNLVQLFIMYNNGI